MSFISGAAHLVAQPLGWGAEAVGGVQDILPGKGTSQLTNLGHNITSPGVTLSNPSGLLNSNNPAFTGAGAYNPAYKQTSGATGTGQGDTTTVPGNSGSGGVAGAGTNTTGYDPTQYAQAVGNTNAAIDRLGNTLNSGNSAIDASYTNALNQLLLGRNQSQQAYNTNKQQTAQDYVTSKNTIGANAGASLQGLQRLLGSRGASGSSAYNTAAPEAVTRGATLQRNDVSNQYGQNQQALDTGWNNYLTGYNNSVADVGAQRDQQKQGLQQSVDNNRATLLQTLAQLTQAQGGDAQPYIDQANQVLNSNSNYNVAPINYQTGAYNAPALSSYTTNQNTTPTFQGQPAANDYFSPYLAALLGKKQPGIA